MLDSSSWSFAKNASFFPLALHAMEHVLQAASVLQRVEPQVATAPQGK